MALDSSEPPELVRSKGSASRWVPRELASAIASALPRSNHVVAVLRRVQATAVYRFFTASLARRIFVSNLMGLLVLVVGILWLIHNHDWLIAAKRESLRVQGEILAAAIAANASLDTDRITFDPERLTDTQRTSFPFRDDGFAAFELSLRPDKVGPVLRRLIQPTHNTRARLYDRDGELIVDTAQIGPRAQKRPEPGERIRTKTPWTRIQAYFDGSELPLYHEIGAANGNAYAEVRQALQGRVPQPMLLINEDGMQIVSLAVPILRRNATLGALLLSTRPGEVDGILSKERLIIFSLAFMAMLTTLMASAMLTRTIAGPVHRLSAAAEQVSQSINARTELPDYSQRRDEVGQLAASFRHMTEALYRRIEAADTFAADVAHELKNPLAAVRVLAETLVTYAKTPEQRDHLIKEIQSELHRLNRLITDVSEASRLEADIERQTNAPLDVAEVLEEVVGVLSDLHEGDNRSIELVVDKSAAGASGLVVVGHHGRISRVVTNLLDNALSFAPPGSVVRLRARSVGKEVEFTVEDDGLGIPEDKLEDIFSRFYSDRPESDQTVGKNSGLGLSISRLIVSGHGGRIWAENRRATNGTIEGARFVVRLPARGSAPLGRRT
jgi:two-component system, OmpR family, sensor histidine kinase ChvG